MLACKYHSFPIYVSFEFNVVSIERKNFPIEVKLVNASMYQKRPDTNVFPLSKDSRRTVEMTWRKTGNTQRGINHASF
jgi:hypothetical protein